MEKYMNDILLKTEDLVNEIKNSNEYKKYIELKEIILSDQKIMTLIEEVKKLQQRIVRDKYNKNDVSNLEEQLKEKLDKLDEYPMYVEFNNVQNELNDTLQVIKDLLEKHINDITN